MCKFRDLRADEIDVRIGQVYDNGLTLLLYKDARCDMNILDETVRPENWQREHHDCKGNLFCRVGINVNFDKPDAPERWIWKSDCGTESNVEAQKGEASDSFKRACVNWGIGRELYTSPSIWVDASDCKIVEEEYQGKKKYKCKQKFEVEKIKIENKRIVGLAIRNISNGKRCFVWSD